MSLCAIVVGGVLTVAPPAGAEAATRIADAGWWWKAQSGLLTTVPGPPGVEEGQLVVQSTPDGAQAIAAVGAVLADGHTDPVLTLDVASAGGEAAAIVLACRAGSAWVGAHAGRWDTRPDVDCATSVAGTPSEDGTQWTFALAPLQVDDQLSVVLVPGTLPDAEIHPSFNLVFEAPTASSVATTGDSRSRSSVPPLTDSTDGPGASVDPSGGSSSTSAPGVRVAPPAASSPVVTEAPAVVPIEPLDDPGPAPSPPAPVGQQAAAAAIEAPEARTLARVVGGVVLLAGLAGAAVSLTSARAAGAAATPEAPVLGGLARFRTERTAEPQPVG